MSAKETVCFMSLCVRVYTVQWEHEFCGLGHCESDWKRKFVSNRRRIVFGTEDVPSSAAIFEQMRLFIQCGFVSNRLVANGRIFSIVSEKAN